MKPAARYAPRAGNCVSPVEVSGTTAILRDDDAAGSVVWTPEEIGTAMNLDAYDGERAKPLFRQLWNSVFALVEDSLAQMSDRARAEEIRDRMINGLSRLRITMDANTRSMSFYFDEPGTGGWEHIFTLTLDNPHAPRPTIN